MALEILVPCLEGGPVLQFPEPRPFCGNGSAMPASAARETFTFERLRLLHETRVDGQVGWLADGSEFVLRIPALP